MLRLPRLSLLFLLAVLVGAGASAFTASNTVPATKAADHVATITANDLKPVECASLNLTAKVTGSGNFSGTSANELIAGSAVSDIVDAGDGDDCVLTGDFADDIDCGLGTDVALSGNGSDVNISGNCETFTQ